jgi:hypothetical protein
MALGGLYAVAYFLALLAILVPVDDDDDDEVL